MHDFLTIESFTGKLELKLVTSHHDRGPMWNAILGPGVVGSGGGGCAGTSF